MARWSILDTGEGLLRVHPDGDVCPAPELAPDLDADDWMRDLVNRPGHGSYLSGAVAVGFDRRRVLVRYDLHAATPRAIDALFDLLREERRGRMVLSCIRFGGWIVEPSPDAHAAIRLHEELAVRASSQPLEKTVLNALCPTQGAAESPVIASLLGDWRRKGRRTPPGHLPALAASIRGGLIVSMDDDGRDLYLAHVGRQAPVVGQYGIAWQARAVGQRIALPETAQRHEARVCSTYYTVVERCEPYFDHVLGCLDLAPGYNVWVRYRRLILPFELDNGTPALFVYCDTSPGAFPQFMRRQ